MFADSLFNEGQKRRYSQQGLGQTGQYALSHYEQHRVLHVGHVFVPMHIKYERSSSWKCNI
jgi:hypothetical protein